MSPEPSPGGSPPAWEPGAQDLVADCRVFKVHRTAFRHPRRQVTSDFFVISSPDWVHVIAHTTDDKVVLVRQYRFGSQEFSLEAPGGLMDADEDPETAARRELLEETGFAGGTAHVLATVRPNPALQQNTCYLMLLEGVHPTAGAAVAWDEHEEIETVVLPAAEALALVRNGAITHSLSLAALLLFDARRRERQDPGPAAV